LSRASAAASIALVSGAISVRLVGSYPMSAGVAIDGISAPNTSLTSTRHGPGRPFRARVKARRNAGTIISGVVTVSALLVMCW
jgi:hypothetical protein